MSESIPAVPPPAPAPAAPGGVVAARAPGFSDRLQNFAWGALAAMPLTAATVLLTPATSGVGTHQQLGLPPCTFLYLTGFPCPFCGMTTSWTHAAHGDLLSAFTTQPMGLVLFLIDVLFAVVLLGRALAGSAAFRPDQALSKLPVQAVWAFFAGTITAWIYKILVVRGWI